MKIFLVQQETEKNDTELSATIMWNINGANDLQKRDKKQYLKKNKTRHNLPKKHTY